MVCVYVRTLIYMRVHVCAIMLCELDRLSTGETPSAAAPRAAVATPWPFVQHTPPSAAHQPTNEQTNGDFRAHEVEQAAIWHRGGHRRPHLQPHRPARGGATREGQERRRVQETGAWEGAKVKVHAGRNHPWFQYISKPINLQ